MSGDCSNSSVEELIKNGISEVDLHPLAGKHLMFKSALKLLNWVKQQFLIS